MLSILDAGGPISEATNQAQGSIGISIVSIAELPFGLLVAPDEVRASSGSPERDPGQIEPLPVDA